MCSAASSTATATILMRRSRPMSTERQPRTARVTLQSRQQFANNRKVPPPPFLDRTWIFTHDVTKEPETQPA